MKNILYENMKRFGTKNLQEQSLIQQIKHALTNVKDGGQPFGQELQGDSNTVKNYQRNDGSDFSLQYQYLEDPKIDIDPKLVASILQKAGQASNTPEAVVQAALAAIAREGKSFHDKVVSLMAKSAGVNASVYSNPLVASRAVDAVRGNAANIDAYYRNYRGKDVTGQISPTIIDSLNSLYGDNWMADDFNDIIF